MTLIWEPLRGYLPQLPFWVDRCIIESMSEWMNEQMKKTFAKPVEQCHMYQECIPKVMFKVYSWVHMELES